MGKKSSAENNIHEIFARNTFLKVKPAFEIGKVLFSFVEFTEVNREVKLTKSVDCYLSVADAALLARKITSFRMYKMIEAERQKGEQYPKEVWNSPLGGVKEEDAKKRGLREDGMAVSRTFNIAPGAEKYKQYAVLTARSQAGKSDENGLIVPVQDKNATVIRVAMANHDEVEKLGIMLEAAIHVYMAEHIKISSYQNENMQPADASIRSTDLQYPQEWLR